MASDRAARLLRQGCQRSMGVGALWARLVLRTMNAPPVRYAKNGTVHIAYSVLGDGPFDMIWCGGFVTHLEQAWEFPPLARMKRRLASFCRLIDFDKRGVGLSDRRSVVASLEEHMDDIRAVLDDAGSKKTVFLGVSEGGPAALLFAATYPERVSAVVAVGSYACAMRDPSQPWGATREQMEDFRKFLIANWGTGKDIGFWAPTAKNDQAYRDWWVKLERYGASPGAVADLTALYPDIDVRHALPLIQAPMLVIHAKNDRAIPVQAARVLAEKVPNARLVELDSVDHAPWLGDQDRVVEEIETFLSVDHSPPELERTLATVLCTDIVNSTAQAAADGDARWLRTIEAHNQIARREIERYRGRLIKTLGDGVLAIFDGPARAVRCAAAMRSEFSALGLSTRAGLHTGEVMFTGDDIEGIAVNIAARVAAQAGPGEVLTSATVRDLVIGSGLAFEDRGARTLKGVPGSWSICAAMV